VSTAPRTIFCKARTPLPCRAHRGMGRRHAKIPVGPRQAR
jgi:hypothetical protein